MNGNVISLVLLLGYWNILLVYKCGLFLFFFIFLWYGYWMFLFFLIRLWFILEMFRVCLEFLDSIFILLKVFEGVFGK